MFSVNLRAFATNNLLWEYLAPLGEDRERMFVHLMQVNHKITHIQQGFDEVKDDIVKRRYVLRAVSKKGDFLVLFDTVLDELLRKVQEQREEFEAPARIQLERASTISFKPSKFKDEDNWYSFINKNPSIKSLNDELSERIHTFSWGALPHKFRYPDEYPFMDPEERKCTSSNYSYEYEESMDVLSSIEFALDIVIKTGKNSGFALSERLPSHFIQLVKCLESARKKHQAELTDSYLRGARVPLYSRRRPYE